MDANATKSSLRWKCSGRPPSASREDQFLPASIPKRERVVPNDLFKTAFFPPVPGFQKKSRVRLRRRIAGRQAEAADQLIAVVNSNVRDENARTVGADRRLPIEAILRQEPIEVAPEGHMSAVPPRLVVRTVDGERAENSIAGVGGIGPPVEPPYPGDS